MKYLSALTIIITIILTIKVYQLNEHVKNLEETYIAKSKKTNDDLGYLTQKYYKIDCWYWEIRGKVVNPTYEQDCR